MRNKKSRIAMIAMAMLVCIAACVVWLKNAGTPAFRMMSKAVSQLDLKNITIGTTTVAWSTGNHETPNGTSIKEIYKGYMFSIDNTAVENMQILETWKNTNKIDARAIGARFEGTLRDKGFVSDPYNSGDATFYSTSGLIKGNVVCLITHAITTPAEQVDDDGNYVSNTTVKCADKTN